MRPSPDSCVLSWNETFMNLTVENDHQISAFKSIFVKHFNKLQIRKRSRPEPLTDKPNGYDRWWISLNSCGIFLGTMVTGEVRKLREAAVWKGPAILPASSPLDSFENRISGFCSALFKYGAQMNVWSLLENRWLNITFGFGRSSQGAVQTVPFLRFLWVTRELPRSLTCLLYVRLPCGQNIQYIKNALKNTFPAWFR